MASEYKDIILRCLNQMNDKSTPETAVTITSTNGSPSPDHISPKPIESKNSKPDDVKSPTAGCSSSSGTEDTATKPEDNAKEDRESPAASEGKDSMKQERTSTPDNSMTNSSITDSSYRFTADSSGADLSKAQLTRMLQGLPFLFPDIQRLASLGGLSLESIRAAAAAGVPAISPPAGGSGVICSCGVKFASRANMEAHKKYYCTQPATSTNNENGDNSGESSAETSDESNSWGLLKCPQCPYTTTHKLSLNGHMNIHTTNCEDQMASTSSKLKSQVPSNSKELPRVSDRYCSDCDIQFSSLTTFRVHKTSYCQTRHVMKGNKSPVREEQPPVPQLPAAASVGQPILVLPTDPVLLVPYAMLVNASILPSHILPQQSPAILTADGQIQPLSLAHALASNHKVTTPAFPSLNLAHHFPNIPTSSSRSPQISPQLNNNAESQTSVPAKVSSNVAEPSSTKRLREGESPLDLTVKRSKLSIKSDLLGDEEKENREVNTPSQANSPVESRNGLTTTNATGEFEGKLLQSPSQVSQRSEGGERSSPQSPRPASAAPNLTSPRSTTHDSPRPSTSASKSPGQISPQTTGTVMPPLPGGFGSLFPGFEANLGSLPFASSLQILQGLQSNTPDLNILKMFNGLIPPMAPNHAVQVKPSTARCNECNITFQKEESFLVHKKHYCAARDKTDDHSSINSSSPQASSSRTSISPPDRAIKTEINTSGHPGSGKGSANGQFVCNPCGIRFQSRDNLTAHQTYYCPKREGQEDNVTKGMWRCSRCRVTMLETLQAGHQCSGPSSSTAHGWRCPCCPIMSPTAAAAQKHLETHAGIKAFKCSVCGYRGNTLRGMRTHIRMHFEKTSNRELKEEDFIECILEEEDRRPRMNNQDIRSNAVNGSSLMENAALVALLSNSGKLVPETTENPISCSLCTFISPNRNTFVKHLAIVHKLGVELKRILENNSEEIPRSKFNNKISSPNSSITPPIVDVKLEPEVKIEVTDQEENTNQLRSKSPDAELKLSSRSVSPRSEKPNSLSASLSITNATQYCHDCEISFTKMESFIAHRNFYCTRKHAITPPETTVQ